MNGRGFITPFNQMFVNSVPLRALLINKACGPQEQDNNSSYTCLISPTLARVSTEIVTNGYFGSCPFIHRYLLTFELIGFPLIATQQLGRKSE